MLLVNTLAFQGSVFSHAAPHLGTSGVKRGDEQKNHFLVVAVIIIVSSIVSGCSLFLCFELLL